MQRDIFFSGPVEEGWGDEDAWTIGGQDVARPVSDAIQDLCEAFTDGNVRYRADIWVEPDDTQSGFVGITVGAVPGYVASLVEDVQEPAQLSGTVQTVGEIGWSQLEGVYYIGPTAPYTDLMALLRVYLEPYAGLPGSVTVQITMQLVEAEDRYNELSIGEKVDRVVAVRDVFEAREVI